MAKRKGLQPPPSFGKGLMEKINLMQEAMKRVQEELAQERLTISVGGDAVTVVIDGQQRLHHVRLSPEAVAQGDLDMLQDLLVVAVNQAIEQSQTLAAERLQGVTGGLGLPGM